MTRPPMLTEKSIQDFKRLYAEEYGVDLSDAEVLLMTTNVLRLLDHVYRPLPGEQHED